MFSSPFLSSDKVSLAVHSSRKRLSILGARRNCPKTPSLRCSYIHDILKSFTECLMWKLITSKTCSPAAWPRRSSSLIVLPSPAHHIVAGWQVYRVSHNTLAIRTASLSSSFGNKPYCEPKITPNPAFLTHPVLSWNHSPQNEYKGDSCRVVALQT